MMDTLVTTLMIIMVLGQDQYGWMIWAVTVQMPVYLTVLIVWTLLIVHMVMMLVSGVTVSYHEYLY